jgi:Fic family protein
MDYQSKIKALQKATGKTQTELAILLGVSFPTLNSWINKRSKPRKKALEKINFVYQDHFGVLELTESELSKKKNRIYELKKKFSNPLKLIVSRKDLYDTFVLELTYNTNSIEGSTLNEPEVKAVIFDGAIIPDKTVMEHQEAKNHQAALGYLFRSLNQRKRKISEDDLRQLHAILMNGIWPNAGQYRNHSVRIAGSNVATANHVKVPKLIKEFTKQLNKKFPDSLAQLAKSHAQFEQIHPFSDGNGRVGRLLMSFTSLRNGFPPVLIKREKKQAYYTYLQRAQIQAKNTFLESFVCDGILESYRLLQ